MFARATFAFVSALHVLAAANVLPRDNQCTSGTVYCCNSLVVPTDPRISTILGLLGVDPASLTDFVGVTCPPINSGGPVIFCFGTFACCTGNSFNDGMIVLGCSPISP